MHLLPMRLQVGAMMKKHLAEAVVPLMVELRYMLQVRLHTLPHAHTRRAAGHPPRSATR